MDGLQQLAIELREIKEKLDVVVIAITGDPTDPAKPGVLLRLDRVEQSKIDGEDIIIRLDRLEQSDKRRIWYFRVMAAGIMTAMISAAAQWF